LTIYGFDSCIGHLIYPLLREYRKKKIRST
jgi:hypothetical protein